MSLFHPPTIVKVLGMVGLSFRLLMCVYTTNAKLFKPLSEGVVMKEKAIHGDSFETYTLYIAR